jgi:hypothetical protein
MFSVIDYLAKSSFFMFNFHPKKKDTEYFILTTNVMNSIKMILNVYLKKNKILVKELTYIGFLN